MSRPPSSQGDRDARCADLSGAAIARALTTRRVGRPVLFHRQIGSTNDAAREQARLGAPDGLMVVADAQTAGRGRLDRSWWSPAGQGLLLSLLLRPSIRPALAAQLTMCLGLGAAEGIEDATGLRAALKWPNDLLYEGRKLGGMLSELQVDGDRLAYAVLGLGVNVNVDFRAEGPAVAGAAAPPMPPGLAETATSLLAALGRPVDRLVLLAAILARFEGWYERLAAGVSPHEAWAGRLDTLGRRVAIAASNGLVAGLAVGVTPEGGLILRDDAGRERVVWSGDVYDGRARLGDPPSGMLL